MPHIPGASVIDEWRGSALAKFRVAHKQMNLPARFLMVDDAFSLARFRCRGVLALPVKRGFVNPVVKVLVLPRSTLFVQRNE